MTRNTENYSIKPIASGGHVDLLKADYTPKERAEIDQLRSRINVARQVLATRVALGLTQEEVGRAAGTKQSRVSDLELMNGNPRFDTLDRIARVLGLMITLVPAIRSLDLPVGYRE